MGAAQDRLDVANRNAGNQRRTLELTQTRLREGRGTGFDTERAQAQRDNADRRLILAVAGRDIEVMAAQRHMPDRAQAFRHHTGVKAGRQDQAVGLLRQSRRSRKECGRGGHQRGKGNRKRPGHEVPLLVFVGRFMLDFLGKA